MESSRLVCYLMLCTCSPELLSLCNHHIDPISFFIHTEIRSIIISRHCSLSLSSQILLTHTYLLLRKLCFFFSDFYFNPKFLHFMLLILSFSYLFKLYHFLYYFFIFLNWFYHFNIVNINFHEFSVGQNVVEPLRLCSTLLV